MLSSHQITSSLMIFIARRMPVDRQAKNMDDKIVALFDTKKSYLVGLVPKRTPAAPPPFYANTASQSASQQRGRHHPGYV
jgi:hypothetical protein